VQLEGILPSKLPTSAHTAQQANTKILLAKVFVLTVSLANIRHKRVELVNLRVNFVLEANILPRLQQ
jgi:hypothetical protein